MRYHTRGTNGEAEPEPRNDKQSQIRCTLEKIEKRLLHERARPENIAAATVLVKRLEYASFFLKMPKDLGLEEFPAVCVMANVCHADLLFETDGETVVNWDIK